jgi:hypothetical protein
MATPTAASVIAITGTKLSESVVDSIIADAALIAANCLVGVADGVETAALKWLAAHLVASTTANGAVTSRKLGDASKSYASTNLGDGLMGTSYGQQAVALLPCLATIGRAQAVIEVI